MLFFLFVSFFSLSFCLKSIQGPVCEVTWTYTGIDSIDVGISAEGKVFSIGTDSKIYQYDSVNGRNKVIIGYTELMNPTSITVTPEGIPIVVANCGNIFFYSKENKDWVRIPGCAKDISFGLDGSFWKTGCNHQREGGFEISRLLCDVSFESIFNNNVLHPDSLTKTIENNCKWRDIEGEGNQIAISPEGYVYTNTKNGIIMKYFDGNWMKIDNMIASDIDISNEGILFIVGENGIVYRSISEELGTWQAIEGRAQKISVGPYSLPAITSFIGSHLKIASKFYIK